MLRGLVWKSLEGLQLKTPLRRYLGGMGSILMLHRVVPREKLSKISANRSLEITPEELTQMLSFLRSNDYDIVSIDEALQRIQSGSSERQFVAITLDDGYKDNLEYALPVFKRFSAPFTIYITTAFPDKKAILWWYLLEEVLCNHDRIEAIVGGEWVKLEASSYSEKEEAFGTLRKKVLNLSPNQLTSFVNDLEANYQLSPLRPVEECALSWEEIGELDSEPLVTIGAHTVNHKPLSKLSLGEARYEIIHSKRILEEKLNKPIVHFAYPFGSSNEAGKREFRMMKQLGFQSATTTRFGNLFRFHKNQSMRLPRIAVTGGVNPIGEVEKLLTGIHPHLFNPLLPLRTH